jgi:RNA polymerase sigma-70 factor (ECF subfamily)
LAGGFESGDVWRGGEPRARACDLQSEAARTTSRHFEERHAAVLRYLLCVSGNRADAEELTQEAFLRLYVEIRDHHEPPNVQAWVFRVAHNLAIDHFRRQSDAGLAVSLGDMAAEIADAADSPEQEIVERERRQRVRHALAWLSPQQRQCLELRAEGLRYREISEVLGIHISSVRTFIVRAVARIAGRSNV